MKAEDFEAMTPGKLAGALERMLGDGTANDIDLNTLDACLDALDKKAPMPEIPDVEALYQAFEKKTEENIAETAPTVITGRRRLGRRFAAVAAAAALIAALVLGAQAAGLDVFGSLARWTDEVFSFLPPSEGSELSSQYRESFQRALEEIELPTELAPSWYPEGFQTEGATVRTDELGAVIGLPFTHADGRFFSVNVEYYVNPDDTANVIFEKDNGDVEEYISNGRRFYIMSNVDSVSAVWTDGHIAETIIGQLSKDEVKRIIDSIG